MNVLYPRLNKPVNREINKCYTRISMKKERTESTEDAAQRLIEYLQDEEIQFGPLTWDSHEDWMYNFSNDLLAWKWAAIAVLDDQYSSESSLNKARNVAEAYKRIVKEIQETSSEDETKAFCVDQNGRRMDLKVR